MSVGPSALSGCFQSFLEIFYPGQTPYIIYNAIVIKYIILYLEGVDAVADVLVGGEGGDERLRLPLLLP